MRRLISLAGVGLVCAVMLWAQGAPAPSAEDQVRRVVQDWLDAESRGDRAALERIIADDFVGAGFGGGVLSKRDIVPHEDAGPRMGPSTAKEMTVRFYGDTAVLIGKAEGKGTEGPGGFRFFIVEQKRGDTWQMVACNLTR